MLNIVDPFLGQLIVAMFLFYSGYGIMYSIQHKGDDYVKRMPRKRLLTTLLNFMVAVCCFWALQTLIFDKHFDWSQILLSMIGWRSIGNSNWYIFIILLCYMLTWVSFKFVKDIRTAARLVCTLCVAAIIPLYFLKDGYWYSTILCYPFGIFWCLKKERIESLISDKGIWIFLGTVAMFIIFSNLPMGRTANIVHNFRSIFFVIGVLMLTMIYPIQWGWLRWLGVHLFSIYIYQRLPMIFFKEFDGGVFISTYPEAYIMICLAITLLIARGYKQWEIKLR